MTAGAYVAKLWDDEGGNTCKEEDLPYETLPPPTVTTGKATKVQYETATVEGTVNPNGPDTHYYFEYGETADYGSKTPEGDAGFGANNVTVSASLSGLRQGTTYHYRLVASSGAGTSYGADQAFTTLTSTPAAVVSSTGTEFVYFRGDNGAIWQATSAGEVVELGGSAVGSPAAVALSSGERDVYFAGTNGAIWRLYWNPSTKGWTLSEIGGAGAGSPAVAPQDPYAVYFTQAVGCQHCIYESYLQEGAWHTGAIGGSAAGDPTVVAKGSEEQVFFPENVEGPGTGDISEFRWTGSEWQFTRVGGTPTANRAAAVLYPSGKESVYFRAREGCIECIDQLYWNGSAWKTEWGTGDLSGAPVAVTEAETSQRTYWRGADRALWSNYGNPETGPWTAERIGGSTVSDPAEVVNGSVTSLYYVDAVGGISETYGKPGAWSSKQICAFPCGAQGSQPPKVTSISPGSGSGTGGTFVTIGGAYFSGVTSVKFGGKPAKSYAVASSTSIAAVAPAGVGTVDVTVTNSQGTSTITSADRFAYLPYTTNETPSAVLLPEGGEDVYFRGENGAIWQATSYGAVRELGGSAVGNPAAVALPSGEQDVYFAGTNGHIWRWYFNPTASDGGHGILPVGGHRISPVVATNSPHGWPSDLPTVLSCAACSPRCLVSEARRGGGLDEAIGGSDGDP